MTIGRFLKLLALMFVAAVVRDCASGFFEGLGLSPNDAIGAVYIGVYFPLGAYVQHLLTKWEAEDDKQKEVRA